MDTLVHLGLLNAALATLLALPAAAARRLTRRPALVHGLWLLVLLKLLTPPFLAVSVACLLRPEATAVPSAVKAPSSAEQRDKSSVNPLPSVSKAADSERPVYDDLSSNGTAIPNAPVAPATESVAESAGSRTQGEAAATAAVSVGLSWELITAAVWLTGSVLWWTAAGMRVVRFRKLLRSASPAPPDVQDRVKRLAVHLGLSRCPRVLLLAAPITPLLWAVIGEPSLLLPSALWARLSRKEQETLLAHELAHLRRGDPWVRRLEIVVLGLYWWHPVVWWARHEIQEAEEECCDAWVLWTLPAAAETYAAALLETVAFLSRLRPALPVGASGAGHTYSLRRRLTMILKGTTPRGLSWSTLTALLVCGAALLPLRPTWGQDRVAAPATDTTPATSAPATSLLVQQTAPPTGSKITGTGLNSDAGLTGSITVPRDIEEAKDMVDLMQAQLEAKKAELLEARALVEQSHRQVGRLDKLRGQGGVTQEEVDQARTELTVREARLQVKQAQIKEAEVRLRQANRWLSRLQSGAHGAAGVGTSPKDGGSTRSHSSTGEKPSAATTALPAYGKTTDRAPSSHAQPGQPDTAASSRVQTGQGTVQPKFSDITTAPAGSDQRIRELEMKLDKLLDELDALRREIRGRQKGGSGGLKPGSSPNGSPTTPGRE